MTDNNESSNAENNVALNEQEETSSTEESHTSEAQNDDGFEWYIIKTMTGQENKVARAIRERIVNFKKTEFFSEVLVPEESVVSNAGGKKRTIKKKFFPGYVLIKMMMNDDTWHLVNSTDKITGFVGGTPTKPRPISEEEAMQITNQSKEGYQRPRSSVNFSEGETVKVVEGPFASFVGTVEEVSDKGKLKVNVSIFGRPTPVELDYSQVEKVS